MGGKLPPMATPPLPTQPRFARLAPAELQDRLRGEAPPLVLDVRRGGAFLDKPGIAGAIPFALDREPIRLPDVERDRGVVVYCL